MPDSCRCLHARAPPPSFTIAIQACASSNNTDQVLLKNHDARHNARRAGAESWPAPPPFCLAVATQSSQAAHRTASMHTRVYLSDNATSIFLSRHSNYCMVSFPLFPFPACIIYASICRGVPKLTSQQQPTPSSFVHRRKQRVTLSTTQATAAPSY